MPILGKKDYLHKAQAEQNVSVYHFLVILLIFFYVFFPCCEYSLFLLIVSLNTNQTTNHFIR